MILFSKKEKTPPVYKVPTSTYKDQFRFGFVSADAASDVAAHFNVKDFPTILLLKSFDNVGNQILETVETIKYDKAEYKLEELKEFLAAYARAEKKEPLPEKKQ